MRARAPSWPIAHSHVGMISFAQRVDLFAQSHHHPPSTTRRLRSIYALFVDVIYRIRVARQERIRGMTYDSLDSARRPQTRSMQPLRLGLSTLKSRRWRPVYC